MRNHLGRIEEPKDKVGGLYAAGWVKRGPSGIIGTNIADAKETVTTILSDMTEYGIRASPSNLDFQEVLRSRDVHVVEWEGYRRIEKEESARRRSDNQPREKIATIEDLLLASQQ